MTYLVFDCRKATGYLFETRRRWVAQVFCVVAAYVFGQWQWDWSASMDFDAQSEGLADWNEVYHHGA